MRRYIILLGLIIFVVSCKKNTNKIFTSPEAYKTQITMLTDSATDIIDNINSLLSSPDAETDTIQKSLINAKTKINLLTKHLESFKYENDDYGLKKTALDMLKIDKQILENQFSSLSKLFEKDFRNWQETDFDTYYKLFDQIDTKVLNAENKLNSKLDEFSEKANSKTDK